MGDGSWPRGGASDGDQEQIPVTVSQVGKAGFFAVHSAEFAHFLQVIVTAVSQMGLVATLQSASAEQPQEVPVRHLSPAGLPVHSADPMVQARQAPDALQMGLAGSKLQSLLAVH